MEARQRQIEACQRQLGSDYSRLPERILLPAVGEEWQVAYRSGSTYRGGAVVREQLNQWLLVTGNIDDLMACREALLRWLRRRARRVLIPRLEEIACCHGLKHGRVSVRQQRTRWGSCSRRKTISVNAGLLFLPSDVVDYVLLHELCHTVELNHSDRFWALLASHDPCWRYHRKILRGARALMPAWFEDPRTSVATPGF